MTVRPAEERRRELVALYNELKDCQSCPLAATRTNVVFGMGNADADLMFVGEAPGFHEDQQGLPFVGRAGKLLDELLEEVGLERKQDTFVANVLKCLRYTAQVQLGDGSWERIGRLVRRRYSGTVMSVDEHGRLVPRRVVGWHATPLADRRVFRLTYRSAKRAGAGRVGIELTGDHSVLTGRGYVPVQELRRDDRIATGQGMTPLGRDVLCGSLLGDASINRASSYLQFTHSQRQAEYALLKGELLDEFQPRVCELLVSPPSGGPKSYPIVQVRTLAHRAIRILRTDFYQPKKRVPTWLTDALNDRMLAFWFMDDGYTRIRPTRRPLAEIASVAFSETDLRMLSRGLGNLGLVPKPLRGRLYFDVATTKELSERIAPYVPQSMRYKLHPDVAAAIPYDKGRFDSGPPEVLFDQVEVEEITDRPRGDTTFFCIDVEGTHNFVTAGGVVHNCRPPGNRDPLPEEIEECRPHLFKQIELIQPKLICTLGNFATKLLSGSPQGITRVHGRPQRRTLGGLEVTLYPLFHPAAALRSTSVTQELRDDFRRIPELLEQELRPDERSEPEAAAPAPAGDEDGEAAVPPQLGLFA